MKLRSTRTTRRRSTLATAIIATAVATLGPARPANAQVAPITIKSSPSPFSATLGQGYTVGQLFAVQLNDPTAIVIAMQVVKSGGVQLGGGGKAAEAVPGNNLKDLLAFPFSATGDGTLSIVVTVNAANPAQPQVRTNAQFGGSVNVKLVAPATTAPPSAPATASPTTVAVTTQTTQTTQTAVTTAPSATTATGGGANRPPVAQSTQVVADAGQATAFTLSASDPDGNAVTFVLAQLPAHGKLTGQAPKLSYTPDTGFLGTDALVFTASDGKESSGQASVTFTVTGATASPAPAPARRTKVVTPVKTRAKAVKPKRKH